MNQKDIFPEVGYTPKNLKYLLQQYQFSREDCAEVLGVSLRTIHAWCVPLGKSSHKDMPLWRWETLTKSMLGERSKAEQKNKENQEHNQTLHQTAKSDASF